MGKTTFFFRRNRSEGRSIAEALHELEWPIEMAE
jgi:hypothetical protein